MPDAAGGETNIPEAFADKRSGAYRRENPKRVIFSSAALVVAWGEGRATADRHSEAPVGSDGFPVRVDEARERIPGGIQEKAVVHEPWKGKTQGSIRRPEC
jgi:hypothetical protein